MRKLFTFAVILVALNTQAAPATEEAVEKLLVVTKTEQAMETLFGATEQMMRQGMQQALQGKPPLTPEQQRILDAMPAKFVSLMREDLSWQKLKPMYVQVYRETFEQHEIEGLTAFYASPTGQVFVTKMPIVMQKSLALSQTIMRSITPRMATAVREAMMEAKVPN